MMRAAVLRVTRQAGSHKALAHRAASNNHLLNLCKFFVNTGKCPAAMPVHTGTR